MRLLYAIVRKYKAKNKAKNKTKNTRNNIENKRKRASVAKNKAQNRQQKAIDKKNSTQYSTTIENSKHYVANDSKLFDASKVSQCEKTKYKEKNRD